MAAVRGASPERRTGDDWEPEQGRESVRVERFRGRHRASWDEFVRISKNGNFLLERDFIEYHKDRFQDHSLMVYDGDELCALLPANREGCSVVSHAGLTFGGFITGFSMKAPILLRAAQAVFDFLKSEGVESLYYKAVPHIYAQVPADEDKYALFLANAAVVCRHVLPVVDMRRRLRFQQRRVRMIAKARKNALVVKETGELKAYWRILTELLAANGANPVHSLEEIEYLKARFPANISLFGAFQKQTLMGGVLVFESPTAARAQYIGSSEEGKGLGAVDAVVDYLLNERFAMKPYFDFGTTTGAGGRSFNIGLSEQKEGFGARTVVQDHYEVSIKAWHSGLIGGILGAD